jgi:hypothetical protein
MPFDSLRDLADKPARDRVADMNQRPTSYIKLLEDIRARVRLVCPAMPLNEFDALTARMAEIEIKYAQQEIFLAIEAATQSRLFSPENEIELR